MGFLTILVALSAAAMASAETTPLDNDNFEIALSLWFSDKDQCISEYGHISDWDTAEVTDMSNLFQNRRDFNEDLSKWNVGSVTTMQYVPRRPTAPLWGYVCAFDLRCRRRLSLAPSLSLVFIRCAVGCL